MSCFYIQSPAFSEKMSCFFNNQSGNPRPKAPTAIHGPSGLKFYPIDKANAIADSLEKQFTPHALCDENHERRVG
jgi:hypothetical protein